jgi:hypothetical protein
MLLNINPSLLIGNNTLAPAHTAPNAQEKKDNAAVKINSIPKLLEINLLDRSVRGSVEEDMVLRPSIDIIILVLVLASLIPT